MLCLGRESSLRRELRRRFVHDVLQELENAHCHSAALETDAFGLALLLFVGLAP